MLSLKYIVLCISCYVVGSSALDVASFIDPCTPEDSACILVSANKAKNVISKGIPELDIEPFNRMVFNDIDASSEDFKLKFKNVVVTGASKAEFVSIKRNPKAKTIKVVIDMPIEIIGQYEMSGKYLLLPMSGNGDCKIKCGKFRVDLDIKLGTIQGKDGKEHYTVKGFTYKFNPMEKVHMSFENMFGGDKTQSEPVQKFIEENSNDMVSNVGGPVVEAIIKKCVDSISKLMAYASADQLEKV